MHGSPVTIEHTIWNPAIFKSSTYRLSGSPSEHTYALNNSRRRATANIPYPSSPSLHGT